MVNMYGFHRYVADFDFVSCPEQVALMLAIITKTTCFLHRFHKQFSSNAQVDWNFWIQKLNVSNMVKVSMRKKNRINFRFSVFKVSEGL
jgi:hypothetical protein